MKRFHEIREQAGAGDWGTDKAREKLQQDTPGQHIKSLVKDKDLEEATTGQLIRRLQLSPKLAKMVRFYLDWRRKNPGQGRKGVMKVIRMMGLAPQDGNILIGKLNSLVKSGKLPKHLALESFEPHMMYDPKTGKGYKANKPEDHERMSKMGYVHDKPDLEEGAENYTVKKGPYTRKVDGKTADKMKRQGWKIVARENVSEGSETWEAGYKRRVVKTTKPEHKAKGYNWRIKGKDKAHLTIKLYKEKPSQEEFNKQMKRVAGHEFGG
jgi:hypothetical protein